MVSSFFAMKWDRRETKRTSKPDRAISGNTRKLTRPYNEVREFISSGKSQEARSNARQNTPMSRVQIKAATPESEPRAYFHSASTIRIGTTCESHITFVARSFSVLQHKACVGNVTR